MKKKHRIIYLLAIFFLAMLIYNFNSEVVFFSEDGPFLPLKPIHYGDVHQRICIQQFRDCREAASEKKSQCESNAQTFLDNCRGCSFESQGGLDNLCSIVFNGWLDACETQFETDKADCREKLIECLSGNDGFGETVPEGFECVHGNSYESIPVDEKHPQELIDACLGAGGVMCPIPKGNTPGEHNCVGGGMELCFEGKVIQCCYKCKYRSDGYPVDWGVRRG